MNSYVISLGIRVIFTMIDRNAWERPPVYKLIQEIGNVPEDDMQATFNLGIGLVAVVDADQVGAVKAKAAELGEVVFEVGVVIRN